MTEGTGVDVGPGSVFSVDRDVWHATLRSGTTLAHHRTVRVGMV